MKLKKIKIIGILILTCMMTLMFCSKAFGGFADYDDVTAEKETQNLLAEQKKEQEKENGKSNNNYLSSLEIEGYEITPQFDKQTIEYSIMENIDKDSIKIIAIPDEQNAKISGAGIVKLNEGENNLRIDVEAENGTVRTYFIKVNTTSTINSYDEEIQNETTEQTIYSNIEDKNNKNAESSNNSNKSSVITIIIAVLILALAIIYMRKK